LQHFTVDMITISVQMQLLRKGANIRACCADKEGGTPLHEAASTSASEAANTLLRYGANPFIMNYHRALL
jgi:ankyrin repeat protein